MTRERHNFTHVVYYQPQGLGLPAIKSTVKNGLLQNAKLWAELHQILSKQAYIVQNRFVLDENALKEGTERVSSRRLPRVWVSAQSAHHVPGWSTLAPKRAPSDGMISPNQPATGL